MSEIGVGGEFAVGDHVWVDEGDSVGQYEFGGVVEEITADGVLRVRVMSHAILAGVPHGTLREALPEAAEKVPASVFI